MQDENQTMQTTNKTEIHLSNGVHLIFKEDKEMGWDDYCTYQDLGTNVKATLNQENNMEVDMSKQLAGNREQKLWLIRFFWDAYNIKFNDLKIKEIVSLYEPIKVLNPLKDLAEVLKD
jgi:hypothetical protein